MPTDELINTPDHVNHLLDVRDTLKESVSILLEA
jgi:hypothetical protein